MKIFPVLLTFVIGLTGTMAQTPAAKDPSMVKIKNYHLPRASDFNTWDISGNIGITYPKTDISASSSRDFGFGVDVTKFISHSFALQASIIHASLSGVDINKPQYGYNSTIHYDATIKALFQFGNISFLKRIPDLAIYGSIGVGVLHYSPHVYLDGGSTELDGIYSQYTQPFDTMDYQNTSGVVIPYAVGVKYRIKDNLSLYGEFSLRTTNSDKLDGFFKLLSEDDDYTYLGFGVVYHLGHNSKTLQWVNPLQIVYDDVYEMKDKIDQVTNDTDQDGVPDLYDVEPNTPPNTKVYGDGSSVDTDQDGVPDRADTEPFSPKNAKVDGSGKDIGASNEVVHQSKEIIKEVPVEKTVVVKRVPDVVQVKPEAVPVKPKVEVPSTVLVGNNYLPSIYFGFNEDFVDPKYFQILRSIADIIKNNPGFNFKVVGNCDGPVNSSYNMRLAKRRADAVKKYLVEKCGSDASRITASTMGKVDQGKGANPMNRRVDFVVME